MRRLSGDCAELREQRDALAAELDRARAELSELRSTGDAATTTSEVCKTVSRLPPASCLPLESTAPSAATHVTLLPVERVATCMCARRCVSSVVTSLPCGWAPSGLALPRPQALSQTMLGTMSAQATIADQAAMLGRLSAQCGEQQAALQAREHALHDAREGMEQLAEKLYMTENQVLHVHCMQGMLQCGHDM